MISGFINETPFHWCCRTCDSPNYYWIISSSRRKLALETDAGCLVLSRNHMKATPCLLVRHKHRHTNHHAAASLPFDFVSVPLGATHDTNATRPATSMKRPTDTSAPPIYEPSETGVSKISSCRTAVKTIWSGPNTTTNVGPTCLFAPEHTGDATYVGLEVRTV